MKTSLRLVPCLLVFLSLSALLPAQDAATTATPPPTPAPATETAAVPVPKHSLDFDIMASYTYRDTFGLSTPVAKFSYAPMVTYNWLVDPNNSVGIVLMRFDHFAFAVNPLYTFSFGFQFKHFWHPEWADLGVFVPWVAYGLLQNWAFASDRLGSAFAYNARISLGTDLILAPAHRLVLQFAWDIADFPAFGTTKSDALSSLSFGVGYRLLY